MKLDEMYFPVCNQADLCSEVDETTTRSAVMLEAQSARLFRTATDVAGKAHDMWHPKLETNDPRHVAKIIHPPPADSMVGNTVACIEIRMSSVQIP